MNLNQLQQGLEQAFYTEQHRIVFWYDAEQSFTEEIKVIREIRQFLEGRSVRLDVLSRRLAPLAVEPMIGTSMRKNTETSRMMNEALRQS